MKKIIVCIVVIALLFLLCFVFFDKKETNDDVLRLHIRANSNSEVDQQVKLKVRDEVVKYVQSKIYNANSKTEVEKIIRGNKNELISTCDSVLKANGFEYKSDIKFKNEFFPTRSYGDISFESGYYDSVIIELGTAKGDNWWCALYPPICFVGSENETGDFYYKSKILEIIENFKKNE